MDFGVLWTFFRPPSEFIRLYLIFIKLHFIFTQVLIFVSMVHNFIPEVDKVYMEAKSWLALRTGGLLNGA